MRALLIAGLLTVAWPASALEIEGLVETYEDAKLACEGGRDHEGRLIPADVRESACADMAGTLKTLRDGGYCFNADRLEWRACE